MNRASMGQERDRSALGILDLRRRPPGVMDVTDSPCEMAERSRAEGSHAVGASEPLERALP